MIKRGFRSDVSVDTMDAVLGSVGARMQRWRADPASGLQLCCLPGPHCVVWLPNTPQNRIWDVKARVLTLSDAVQTLLPKAVFRRLYRLRGRQLVY